MNKTNTVHILTEWLSDTNASSLLLHIYTIPVRNFHETHKENGDLARELQKLNGDSNIAFYEQLIVSWNPIHHWGDNKFAKYEYRTINTFMFHERSALERLLLRTIENAQLKAIISAGSRKFTWLKAEKTIHNISIHRIISLDMTVNEAGQILLGFDSSHSYRTNETVLDLISSSGISKGDRVIDIYNNMHYEFIEVSPFVLEQPVPELNQSVIEYFIDRKQEWKIKKLDPKMPVVYVKMSNGQRVAYAPTMLRKELTLETLPANVIKQTSEVYKQNVNQKMKVLLEEVNNIVSRDPKITFSKPKLLVESCGYRVHNLQPPKLLFGNNRTHSHPKYGLDNGGSYSAKPMAINVLMNPQLIKNHLDTISNFTTALCERSQKWGVPIEILKKSSTYRNREIDFTNPNRLAILLKELAGSAFNELTLVITTEREASWYDQIKKEFGGNSSIPTQFVSIKTLTRTDDYTIGNILLGLYAKSGIQPWLLNQPLFSDCFIGLDVSHEAGRHSAGIVQVVGRDGRVLSSKANTSNEAGEKIRHETMTQIVYSAIGQYKKHYGELPKHLTFHRDGLCREDLERLDEVMSDLGVAYDMVEIVKKSNRRMAQNTNKQGWETTQGCVYFKENTAYITATNPHPKIGVALPIKIVHRKGSLNMDEIVQDVYNLSFMHIGALQKCRLPITTYYADLSSTFFNRQWLPSDSGEALHFV
ncbi:MAG: hypothetical protein K0Q73_8074 [Paenibacillus sp.]|nr:hypothetical protein [Paenibacillus sp.]